MVTDESGQLLGMVMPRIERGDKTHLELGTIVPIVTFSKSLSVQSSEGGGGVVAAKKVPKTPSMAAMSAVVLVCVNSSWGSGVCVSSKGHILTCAHLFKGFTRLVNNRLALRENGVRVTVCFRDEAEPRSFGARLVYCSRSSIDVALLQVETSGGALGRLCVAEPSLEAARTGDACSAIGYAIFDPSSNMKSTVSAGVVSKVVAHPRALNRPVMIQTSTSVFRGHSGGMLANREGKVLGLLTSNARHSNGLIIPTINFVLPVNVLQPLLGCVYLDREAQDPVFRKLDTEDAEVASTWSLEHDAELPRGTAFDQLPKDSNFASFLKDFGRSKL